MHYALVNIHAVVIMGELEPGEAQTVVGTHCVFTGAISTWLSVTLVDIHAHGLVRRRLEAVVTQTAIAALSIDTLTVTANVRDLLTLVTIQTSTAR